MRQNLTGQALKKPDQFLVVQKPIPWHMDGITRHATSGPLSLSLSPLPLPVFHLPSSQSLSGVMPPAADHLNNGGKLEEPTQRDSGRIGGKEEGRKRGER